MKKGYHAVYDNNIYEAISFAAESQFDFVQFDLGVPRFFLDNIPDAELIRIAKFAEGRNIRLTFHGPCDNVSLFCDYPAIRSGILEQYKIILYKANLLNARHITLHTGSHPGFRMSGRKTDDYIKQNSGYYADLLRENLDAIMAMRGGVLVCVENDGFTPFVMESLESMLSEGMLNLTVDIPKLYSSNQHLDEDVCRFMRRHKSSIREAHIHDFSPTFGRHQIIGNGNIDFSLFSDMIFRNDVYLSFEVRPKEAALDSMRIFSEMYEAKTSTKNTSIE